MKSTPLDVIKDVLKPAQFNVLNDVVHGNSIDTKDSSIRANVGVLIRKGYIVKTEVGYKAADEVLKAFKNTLPKEKRQTGVTEETRFNSARFRSFICEHLNIRGVRDYACNVFIIPQKNKSVHQFEISHRRIRMTCKSEEFARLAEKNGFTVRPSKNKRVWYVDYNEVSEEIMKKSIELVMELENVQR